MKRRLVAKRFAKALIDIAVEENSLEKTGQDLSTIYGVFSSSPELYTILSNPIFAIDERRSLATEVAGAAGVSDSVKRLLDILVESRRINILGDVVAAYRKLEDEIIGRVRAVVESPVEPTGEILDAIGERLKAYTGKDVVITYRRNADLLGGAVIKLENTVIDGSLRTKLEALRRSMLEAV